MHKGRWCKGRRTAKKPSRKGTVADKVIQRLKVNKFQENYDKIKIGTEELKNVFSFVYLGAEVPSDGDPSICVIHHCDIAWGRFGEYRKTLMSAQLPVIIRSHLYNSLISTSTLAYGCEA